MQHDPVRLIRSCAACQTLDGAASDTPPHAEAAYETSVWVRPDEPGVGRVTRYRCRACGVQLQRFTRACALDGWLVVPAGLASAMNEHR